MVDVTVQDSQLLGAIAEYLFSEYRGFPGDLTDPKLTWEQLRQEDRDQWRADAQDLLDEITIAAVNIGQGSKTVPSGPGSQT